MKLRIKIFILLSLTVLFTACDSKIEPSDVEEAVKQVILEAKVKELRNSRASSEGSLIIDQEFNLTFLSASGYEVGKVDFNSSGIGFSFRYDSEGKTTDLIWSYVSPDELNGNTYSFFLDNLPDHYDRSTTVNLPDDPDANPYSIGVFDEENGSNDLIWGSAEKVMRASSEKIDLYHVMSRFCLRVYLDNSNIGEELYPVSAGITNIFQSPVSFDRLSGKLELKKSENGDPMPDSEPFILVATKEGWETISDSEDIDYYSSPDFILPPQNFVANQRPRLSVTLNNGEVYSGLFPLAMSIIDDDGVPIPWTMSFLRGTKLTISVKLSNQAASMQFLPATLLEWWDKGEKTFTGNQASVSKQEELELLIQAYADKKTNEFYKWGYQKTVGSEDSDNPLTIWVFNIFKNLEIDGEKLRGSMPEQTDLPYEFNLHNAIVTVNLANKESEEMKGEEGAAELKRLLNDVADKKTDNK